MVLCLKAAVVLLAESLQRWSVLLAPLLEGWKHTRSPSRLLHLPGKSSLPQLILEAAFLHALPKPSSHCTTDNSQQIGSVPNRRDEAAWGWHSRLVVETYLHFHSQAALSLTRADSSVGSPLGGVVPWLLAWPSTPPRLTQNLLLSQISRVLGCFQSIFQMKLRPHYICRNTGKYPCMGTESSYLILWSCQALVSD